MYHVFLRFERTSYITECLYDDFKTEEEARQFMHEINEIGKFDNIFHFYDKIQEEEDFEYLFPLMYSRWQDWLDGRDEKYNNFDYLWEVIPSQLRMKDNHDTELLMEVEDGWIVKGELIERL